MRHTGHGIAGIAALLLLIACGTEDKKSSPTVTVPVTQAAPDPSYILDTTATVTSEKLAREHKSYGRVTVRARRGESESNRTPLLSGTLSLKDGTTLACSMDRDWIWHDFENFMELNLWCDADLDPTQATGFVVQ